MKDAILRTALFSAFGLVLGTSANAETVSLTATASGRYAVEANTQYLDNFVTAYYCPIGCSNFGYSGPYHVNGFLQFDLSAVPDNAVVTGLSLTAFITTIYNYSGLPTTNVHRSAFDGWTRTSGAASVSLDQLLGAYTVATGGWTTWTLNASAGEWSEDLADDRLTLAFSYPLLQFGGINFDGSDLAATAPQLTITYAPVPLPAAAWLLLSGLGGLGFVARRRKAA